MPKYCIQYLNLFTLIAFSLTFYGCDSHKVGETPSLDISSTRLNFPSIPPDSEPITQDITLSNHGIGDLKITAFEFHFEQSNSYRVYWDTDEDNEQVFTLFDPTSMSSNTDAIITIDTNESIRLIIVYSPDTIGANGRITFKTNDVNYRNVEIDIIGEAIESDVRVNPGSLDFERVLAGTSAIKEITLTNFGSAAARFNEFVINGSNNFTVYYDDQDIVTHPTMVPNLAPSESLRLQVHYTPNTDGEDTGTLVISTENRQFLVNLIGNSAVPCINVLLPDTEGHGNEVRFNQVITQQRSEQIVIIESCGAQNLDILDIRIEGNDIYSLGGNIPNNFPVTLAGINIDNSVRPQGDFKVLFEPETTEIYQAELVIESNDPLQSELRIPILGRGTHNHCPTARVNQSMIQTLPLDIITLDASPSVDLDGLGGLPVHYEWTVVSRPNGSTAQPVENFINFSSPSDSGIPDDVNTATALFFVDFVGDYEIQLTVTDDMGLSAPSEACPQVIASIFIESRPDSDIVIELSWSTPSDQDETDLVGSDVDLYLAHFNAAWESRTDHCHYNKTNPDWGADGVPSLDLDDRNGAGPETITFNDPGFTNQIDANGSYKVGVHYYNDHGLGASDAYIKVYLQGQFAGEWTHTLNRSKNFWETAGIIWTDTEKRVQEINRFYESVF